jgi:hypothetical protein
LPSAIAKLCGLTSRSNNISEQDRGEDALYLTRMLGAGEEFLNLTEDRLNITDKDQMVVTLQLHKFRLGDLGCNVSPLFDIDVSVAAAVQN